MKCADGRLYHPVVAEKAIAAFAAKEKYAYEKYCDRLRKENARRAKEGKPLLCVPPQALWKTGAYPHGMAPQGDGFPPEVLHPSAGNPPETGLKGNRKERSRERDGEEEGDGDGTDLLEGAAAPLLAQRAAPHRPRGRAARWARRPPAG